VLNQQDEVLAWFCTVSTHLPLPPAGCVALPPGSRSVLAQLEVEAVPGTRATPKTEELQTPRAH